MIVEYCKYGNLPNDLKSKHNLFCLNKDAALHMEPKKENLESGLEQDQKPTYTVSTAVRASPA